MENDPLNQSNENEYEDEREENWNDASDPYELSERDYGSERESEPKDNERGIVEERDQVEGRDREQVEGRDREQVEGRDREQVEERDRERGREGRERSRGEERDRDLVEERDRDRERSREGRERSRGESRQTEDLKNSDRRLFVGGIPSHTTKALIFF